MSSNIILDKTYGFALDIVQLYKKLTTDKKEYTLSKQLLRSGTSIGANTEEAIGAQSKKDFIHKFSIAYQRGKRSKVLVKVIKRFWLS